MLTSWAARNAAFGVLIGKPNHMLGRSAKRRQNVLTYLVGAITGLTVVGCSWGENGRYFDHRLDDTTYFIEEIRQSHSGPGQVDRRAEKELLCHQARLTLKAGFDSFASLPSNRSPEIVAKAGESLHTATIRMTRGIPSRDQQERIDARIIRRWCRGW